MADSSDLQRRLRRLRAPSKRHKKPPRAISRPRNLPPGQELDTPLGAAYCIEEWYGARHRHGASALGDLLAFEAELAAEVAGSPDLAGGRLQNLAFVDLETTGLVGGAGTLGFLVGIGRFENDGFMLRQYFLRDPAQEAGMLHALAEVLEPASGIVSFNGRNFDLPLLEMRYTVAMRRRWKLTAFPQLDLLYPARRLWRRGLPDCRLSTLESHILGVERSEDDVPGELIPGMYLDFLRTGDASDMARVVYHNAVDILSLVGLATAVLQRHRSGQFAALSGEEALAVARWHQSAGRIGPAEAAYQAAVAEPGQDEVLLEALRQYTAYLKREGRRADALLGWESWHQLAPDDPRPCIELAKYYEWHAPDLMSAHRWTSEGLLSVSRWPSGWRKDQAKVELEHRLKRLERKLGD